MIQIVLNKTLSGRLVWLTDFQRKPRFGSKIAERVVESEKRLSVMINTSNELNIVTVWNVRTRRHQWTVGLVHRFAKETSFRFKNL